MWVFNLTVIVCLYVIYRFIKFQTQYFPEPSCSAQTFATLLISLSTIDHSSLVANWAAVMRFVSEGAFRDAWKSAESYRMNLPFQAENTVIGLKFDTDFNEEYVDGKSQWQRGNQVV